MTHPLLTWYEAQLAADERIARAATPGPWRYSPSKYWRKPGTSWSEEAVFAGDPGPAATCIAGTGDLDDPQSVADAEHIALHDPAAVLQDIAAKRAMLDDIFAYEAKIDGEWGCCCSAQNIRDGLCPETPVDEIRGVRILASGFATRPGYLEDWRPT